jgi:protein N-terminal methyltransferase
LKNCKKLLKVNGYIVVKDNVILPKRSNEEYDDILLDQEDSSITRSERYLLKLFNDAGLNVIHKKIQKNFPKQIFPVIMYALQ